MRSKFAIAGHPIHPMLVAIPIGLFAWALTCDVIYAIRDYEQLWYNMSFWTGIVAWITAVVAALPGLGDYPTIGRKSDAASIGLIHMMLNVTVIVLYIIAMIVMLDNGAVTGGKFDAVFGLHAAGVALLGISGWLGGEMVFRHHLGMA